MEGDHRKHLLADYDRVLALLREPAPSMEQLERRIEDQPMLADAVLRAVNSSSSGLRSPVTSLQRAIAMLGLRKLRERVETERVAIARRTDGASEVEAPRFNQRAAKSNSDN